MICMNNPKVFISYSWHPEENKIRGGNCLALALLESVLVVVLCVVLIKIIDINKYLNLIFFGK